MTGLEKFNASNPLIVAALHLPPFPASGHPDAKPISAIIEFSLRNAGYAVGAGIPALYLQDIGDYPWAPAVQPHTIATMSVIGEAIRREFPDLYLGVCLMSQGAREPLAIAQAISAQFIRLKVYTGAMVKAEGIVQACAYEAITYRAQIHAEAISILADVYDRSGEPLGRLPLAEAATQAAVFGRADGLILTGHSFGDSLQMLDEVHAAKVGVPLLLGGSATPDNIVQALKRADGVIVSTALKPVGEWSHAGLASDWDKGRCAALMDAVRSSAASV
jgi:uncharacterized protein